jgi:hypothetical protein
MARHSIHPRSKDWWRHVVWRTFENAGQPLPETKRESVFSRVYSIFGLPTLSFQHSRMVS